MGHDPDPCNHLGDLQRGDGEGHNPRDTDVVAKGLGGNKVVKVHDRMNKQVHIADVICRRENDPPIPAVPKGDDMMIPMQGDHGFLLEYKKKGVEQLGNLGEDKHKAKGSIALAVIRATGAHPRAFANHEIVVHGKALPGEGKEGKDRERKVPDGQTVIVEPRGGRSISHISSEAKERKNIKERKKQGDFIVNTHELPRVADPGRAERSIRTPGKGKRRRTLELRV